MIYILYLYLSIYTYIYISYNLIYILWDRLFIMLLPDIDIGGHVIESGSISNQS